MWKTWKIFASIRIATYIKIIIKQAKFEGVDSWPSDLEIGWMTLSKVHPYQVGPQFEKSNKGKATEQTWQNTTNI